MRVPAPRRVSTGRAYGSARTCRWGRYGRYGRRRGPSRRRDGADLRPRDARPIPRAPTRSCSAYLRPARRRRPRDVDGRRARRAPRSSTGDSARSARPRKRSCACTRPRTGTPPSTSCSTTCRSSSTRSRWRSTAATSACTSSCTRSCGCGVRPSGDAAGHGRRRPTSVHSSPGEQVLLESWTHIEIDRETSAEILDSRARRSARRFSPTCAPRPATGSRCSTRCTRVATELEQLPPPCTAEDLTEGKALLQWLADQHFTFLGYRAYRPRRRRPSCCPSPGTGLGLLRDAPEDTVGELRRAAAGGAGQGAREDAARADEGERALDRAPLRPTSTTSGSSATTRTARSSASTGSSVCTRRVRTRAARSRFRCCGARSRP